MKNASIRNNRYAQNVVQHQEQRQPILASCLIYAWALPAHPYNM